MNVILIVIDTLRADHLGCYGYFRNTSPNIDRLSKEGVTFKDAHASAIPTGPGFSSIFTGLFPINHGVYITPWNIPNLIDFDDSIPTLPEIIQKYSNGYTTVAFDNLINFYSHMDQFVRGFEYYINVTRTPEPVHHTILAEKVNERLLPWLKGHKNEKFFIFAHYWDPHTPYNQPEKFRKIFCHRRGNMSDLKIMEAKSGYSYIPGWGPLGEIWDPEPSRAQVTIDLYDGEIRYVDYHIGELVKKLEKLKILNETIIIITSDHGEQLGHHGWYAHDTIYESVIHIPMIFWSPGRFPSGKVVKGYVQHVDIMPTILDLLKVKENFSFDGVSLLPMIYGNKKGREEIFVEDYTWRGVIQKEWKYVRDYITGINELYNLKTDPMEIINLSKEEPERLKSMRNRLNEWVRSNLRGKSDPIWSQIAKWAEEWDRRFGKEQEFWLIGPKPTLIEGVDYQKK